MRLAELHLLRYGPFADLRLTLDPRPGALNVLCAPNGAGKSALRNALAEFLFGIGGQTPMMKFAHGHSSMRLNAELLLPNGARRRVTRRKGQGNTLLAEDGTDLPADFPALLTGGMDRPGFERLFALDSDRLRAGGEAMTKSGGMVADALLAAGGLTGARSAIDALYARADSLAPKTKSARPFYLAADRFTAATKDAAAALRRPQDRERDLKDLAALKTAADEAAAAASEARTELARLARLRRLRPCLHVHDSAAAWLAANSHVQPLPATLRDRLQAAAAERRAAARQLEQEEQRLADLQAQCAALTPDEDLLARAAAIEEAAADIARVRDALQSLPDLAARRDTVAGRIAQTCRDLGAQSAADPASLIPPSPAAARIETLAAEGLRCAEQIRTAAASVREEEASLARLMRDAVPHAPLDPALADLVAEIAAPGDPGSRTTEAADALARSESALKTALSAVPGWTGDAEALAQLPPPALPAAERLHAAREAAERREDQAKTDAARVQDAATRASQRLVSLIKGGPIPDDAAIAAFRAERDELWRAIAGLAFEGRAPRPPTPAGPALALAYERAVAAADAIADRRAAESNLVAEAGAARAALDAAQRDAGQASQALNDASASRHAAHFAWEAALPPPLRNAGRRLDDLRQFATARERVLERLEARNNARDHGAGLSARHAAWATRLRQATNAGAPIDSADDTLPALLAEARRQVKAAEKSLADAQTHARLAQEAEARLEKCRRAEANATDAFAAWRSGWADALRQAGRPATETPEEARAVLDLFRTLKQDLAEAERLDAAITAQRSLTDQFTERAGALSGSLLPNPADALAAIADLSRQSRAARDTAQKLDALRQQAAAAQRHVTDRGQALARRTEALAQILAEAGADTVEAAEARLDASEARAKQVQRQDDALETIARDSSAAETLDALRAALDALPPGQEDAATQGAEARLRTAETARDTHLRDLAVKDAALRGQDQDSAYAVARAAGQEAAATAGRTLRDALTARLAAAMLEDAMEAAERDASPAMLRAIDRWFGRLTLGAYAAGREPGGTELLLTHKDWPHEPRRVPELSEGTRDQLFLALRLAAIEGSAAPLPFVADDILQTFDDGRAAAALDALAALSEHTQVILLTHHRHVLDLAGAMPGGRVHVAGPLPVSA